MFPRIGWFRAALLLYFSILALPRLLGQVSVAPRQPSASGALSGAMNPNVRREDDRGPLEGTRKLPHMTLVFRRSAQQAELARFLEELQDPLSANFHRWLTPEQFGERFGASAETLDRASNWLRSEGFTVESTARGRGWIVFSGTIAQVQNTFRTEIHRYQVGAKAHFAPSAPPSVPAEFANDIGSIRGLDDFHLEPSRSLQPLLTASDGTHFLAPGDVARIYGIPTGFPSGAGITIAVAGASAVNLADIRQFRSMFQLPANDPQTMLAGVDPGVDNSGPLLEADADLEWVGGIARGATVLYAYATDVLVASETVIDQNLASILVFSFGQCEANISQGDAAFTQGLAQQANAQGITWIASSGDAGAATCDRGTYPATRGLSVSFPASLPEVTAVGGTEFNEPDFNWNSRNSSDGTSVFGYLPEVGWNDTSQAAGLRASGGGASKLFAKPTWQAGTGVPDDQARDVPDLSFSASPAHDPYIVISGGKTYGAGGTSLSGPVFGGILATTEQPQHAGDVPGFGNINPSLYALANQPLLGAAAFNDITAGNNVVPCSGGTQDCVNGSLGYTAGPGYDLVTGLGSLNVPFFSYLQLQTVTRLDVSATEVLEGMPVTLTATVQSYNGSIPQGAVGFGEDNSPGFTSNLDSTGKASVTVTLPHGTHSIKAAYPSTCCRFAASTSNAVTVVVDPAPPSAPALASPADNVPDVSVSVMLTWAKTLFATSYDVYFGTAPNPPFWGNVTDLFCTPGALAPNTKYYWRVASRDASGATASEVRSFTTASNLYTISTIAGSTAAGFSPDGTAAASALLSGPIDVALDRGGNLYVVEATNNRIRKIGTTGIVTTIAGGGTGGDGGPAASARIDNPGGIVLDAQGNIYFTETFTSDGRSSIRKISPDGIITTVAGGISAGYSGDGPAAGAQLRGPAALALDSQGNLYFPDGGSCVRKISAGVISTVAGQCVNNGYYVTSDIGDGGPATSAELYYVGGVAVDAAGNLYIADTGNCRLRKVTDGIITTVAGATEGGLGCGGGAFPLATIQPVRVAIDPAGSPYFTSGNSVVKLSNGVTVTLAGGGTVRPGDGAPATSVQLGGLVGLAVDSGGRIYLAESFSSFPGGPSYSQSIRLLTPSSSYILPAPSIFPGGVQNSAGFGLPPVAPGSIVNVFGNFSFGSGAQSSSTPLPTQLSGLSIQFQLGAGVSAPLFYASAGQINIQVPWELAGQTSVPFRAALNGVNGPSQTLKLAAFAPGIFIMNTPYPIAAITDSSYRLVEESPASAGDLIQIYCTGLGAVTNPPASGSPASSTTLSVTTTKPTVNIGGIPAQVIFSGLAPGTVGEYQVNVQIPAGLAPGPVPVVLSIGGASSNMVTIPVR